MTPKLKLVSAAEPLATRTHCPYCAFQCGMTLRHDDGGVEVRADPDFPVNRGQMCIKGFNSAALLHHPGRVTAPLVRGRDGTLRRTTWPAALSFIAERLRAIRERHGADANGAFGSGALTNEKAFVRARGAVGFRRAV